MRRWQKRLMTALFGLALALMIAEVGVRILVPYARSHSLPAGMLTMDRDLGWALTPGSSGIHRSPYFQIRYQIDGEGRRDHGQLAARPRRILVFGDSYVFGWGVEAEERFTEVVERLESDLRLVNQAVPGYGLDQQVRAYERSKVAAEEVLFFVSADTLARTGKPYMFRKHRGTYRLQAGELVPVNPPATRQVATFLLHRLLSWLELPYYLDKKLQALTGKPARAPVPPPALSPLQAAVLNRGLHLAREKGHKVTIIATTPADQLEGFIFPDGVRLYQVTFPEGMLTGLGPRDGHWNAEAHRHIGTELRSTLVAPAGQ